MSSNDITTQESNASQKNGQTQNINASQNDVTPQNVDTPSNDVRTFMVLRHQMVSLPKIAIRHLTI